jgi:lauroyl/myristoyl acyltransferase
MVWVDYLIHLLTKTIRLIVLIIPIIVIATITDWNAHVAFRKMPARHDRAIAGLFRPKPEWHRRPRRWEVKVPH